MPTWTPGRESRVSAPVRVASTRFHFPPLLRVYARQARLRPCQPDTASARGVAATVGAGGGPQGPSKAKACNGVNSGEQHRAGAGGGRMSWKRYGMEEGNEQSFLVNKEDVFMRYFDKFLNVKNMPF